MGNLVFPQLSTGALVQFPLRKRLLYRTVTNTLADGRVIAFTDSSARKYEWELNYSDLSFIEVQQLQAHFGACSGPLRSFTFIDPTGNMFVDSLNLGVQNWKRDPLLSVENGIVDPNQGLEAFRLTNNGQASQTLSQMMAAPSSYQYCFSVYARSQQPSTIVMFRSGTSSSRFESYTLGTSWTRIVLSSRLQEQGQGLSAGLALPAGQQVEIYGMQMEAQVSPSSYKATDQKSSAVFVNAHWGTEELSINALGPDQFSALAVIEASIQD